MCSCLSLSEAPTGPTRDALLTSTRPLGAPLPCPSPHRRSSSLPGMSGLGPPGSESPCSLGSPGVTAWASLCPWSISGGSSLSLMLSQHLSSRLDTPAARTCGRHRTVPASWGSWSAPRAEAPGGQGPPSLGLSPPVGSSLQAPGSGACSRVSTSGACPAVTGGCRCPAATEAPCHRACWVPCEVLAVRRKLGVRPGAQPCPPSGSPSWVALLHLMLCLLLALKLGWRQGVPGRSPQELVSMQQAQHVGSQVH